MTTFPSLDEVLGVLSEIIGNQPVNGDAALAELVIDSLDLLEWAFALDERYQVRVGEDLIAGLDYDKPLRELYEDLRARVISQV